MENTRDLLVRGIAAAKARLVGEARFYLEWVLRLDPPKEQKIEALYWLSTLVTDPEQEREVLETILADEPFEPRARRRLLIIDGKINSDDLINPETYKQEQEAIPGALADQFTCPNCGGRLAYSTDGGSLQCEYCNSHQFFRRQTATLSNDTISGQDFIAAMATSSGHNQSVEQQLLTCGACGAEFLLANRMISTDCPFCLSASVVNFNTTRHMIPPARIIPIEVGFPQAFEAACAALSGDLVKDDVQNVRPAFFPVWQFELNGQVSWRIPAADMSDGDGFSGEETVDSYTVPVMAVSGILAAFPDLALDFEYSRVQTFAPHFLVDCLAVGYQLPLSDAALQARGYTVRNISRKIGTKIGRRNGDFFVSSSDLYVTQFWSTLVPIWIFADPITDKMAVVNGQNGHTRTGMRAMDIY